MLEKASLPVTDFWLPGGRSWRYTSWFSTHNPLGGAKWRWKIFAVMKKGIVGIFGILKEICSDFLFVGLHGWTFWYLHWNHHIVRGAEFSREENAWTFQDMSSEYTGIIGVGTADDGGAEFEDLWLHSGTVPCHSRYISEEEQRKPDWDVWNNAT